MHHRSLTLALLCILMPAGKALAEKPTPRKLLEDSRRIVFLGDSITYGGGYVMKFDGWLQTQYLDPVPTVINVGLPSETVSGLSEDGHAGGRFPRPDLFERLDRVLDTTKPDLVLACYGINCGIYQPLDEGRFKAYRKGIENLKQKVEEAGAKLVIVTPPTYDDARAKKNFSYNGVLDKYSEWLLSKRAEGWHVIDLHGAMAAELAKRRESDPNFTFQPDAVHPNADGHEAMSRVIREWFGGEQSDRVPAEIQKLVQQRSQLLRDAYLSAAKHKRPGIRGGLPLPEAAEKAQKLTKQIESQK